MLICQGRAMPLYCQVSKLRTNVKKLKSKGALGSHTHFVKSARVVEKNLDTHVIKATYVPNRTTSFTLLFRGLMLFLNCSSRVGFDNSGDSLMWLHFWLSFSLARMTSLWWRLCIFTFLKKECWPWPCKENDA